MNFLRFNLSLSNNNNYIPTNNNMIPEYGNQSAPRWQKVTKTYADFATAAELSFIDILEVNNNTLLHTIAFEQVSAFGSNSVDLEGLTFYVSTPTGDDSNGVLSSFSFDNLTYGVLKSGTELPTIINSSGIVNISDAEGTVNLKGGLKMAAPIGDITTLNDLTNGAVNFWFLVSYITNVA
jgi:hypothetical protein